MSIITSISRKINISNLELGQIVSGEFEYDDFRIFAKNLKLVGNPNDPGIEITEIALEYGFELAFSDETEKEIKKIQERNKRVELDKAWETSKTRKIRRK